MHIQLFVLRQPVIHSSPGLVNLRYSSGLLCESTFLVISSIISVRPRVFHLKFLTFERPKDLRERTYVLFVPIYQTQIVTLAFKRNFKAILYEITHPLLAYCPLTTRHFHFYFHFHFTIQPNSLSPFCFLKLCAPLLWRTFKVFFQQKRG